MSETSIMTETDKFYSDAVKYWENIPPTIEGMLGGYGYISQIDIQGSNIFIKQLFRSKMPPGRQHAVDCGAGIGRITRQLLLNIFDKVDLVEQNSAFLEKSKEYIGPKLMNKIGNLYAVGLQNFQPESNKYDVIWVQWVLGHLTDSDLLQFLENCQKGLKPNGMIIIKENITSSGIVETDERDSSVTRPLGFLKGLFIKANLDCYRQLKQTSFPKELYNVYMFALRPKTVIFNDTKSTDNLLETKSCESIQINVGESNLGLNICDDWNNTVCTSYRENS